MADNKKNFPIVLSQSAVKSRFEELLAQNAPAFISTLLAIWNGNEKLQECDSKSILGAAGFAANLKLSLDPSLGLAYVVPYKGRATFQIGWKGLKELALRTGEYKTLNAGAVYEGQIKEIDFITGEIVRGEKISDKVVGYVAYMELLNGFSKSLYMTIEEIQAHAEKYSQSYGYDLKNGKKSSVWTTNFDAMAKKTVFKLLLTRWGKISSTDIKKAVQADQGVVIKKGDGTTEITYVDNDGRTVPLADYDDCPIGYEPNSGEVIDYRCLETVDSETGKILEVENNGNKD